MVWLMVGIGGALGAPMRFLTDRWMQWWAFGDHESHAWPLGTLVVNLSGGFILGLIVGATRDGSLGPLPAAALGTGLCGALTTFSTVSVEVVRLVEDDRWAGATTVALTNLILSVALGAVGLRLATVLF
ncbi:MAG: CrcB family protein [Candidatus Microthrix sp.]|nr:CrcB family protein [Candidatus Microthrix sp.]